MAPPATDGLALGVLDWLTIGGYLAASLAIGAVFARRAGASREDFYLSGRALPWWLLGTSMVATTFALDTPLLISQTIVSFGLYGNWIWLSLAISHLFVTFFLAGRWRRAGVVTDAELCEVRYGGRSATTLRAVKGLFFAFVLNGITLGGVLFAVKQICYAFGVDQAPPPGEVAPLLAPANLVLLAGLALALVYSLAAGFWGVVATDFLQFLLAMVGAVLVAGCALADERVGGLGGLIAKVKALGEHKLSLAPEGLSLVPLADTRATFGPLHANDQGLTFLVFLGVMWWAWKYADGGGILIQRMSAARDERHATLGTLWFCLAHYVLRWWPWAVAGLCALVVLDVGSVSGHALTQLANESYPRLVAEVVPIGLRGLVLAYFAAAFMSTIDTHLNLGSAYLVHDVYRRFIVRSASERHYVLVGRLACVVIVCLAALASELTHSLRSLLGFILNLIAGAGSVFLLRWLWWRISAWSELSALAASLVIGGGLTLFNKVYPDVAYPYWQVTLANVFGSAAIWLSVTLLTPPTPRRTLLAFYERTRPLGVWGPVRRALGLGRPPAPWAALAAWLGSVAACFGSLVAIRDLLAGACVRGGIVLALCVLVGALVVRTALRLSLEPRASA